MIALPWFLLAIATLAAPPPPPPSLVAPLLRDSTVAVVQVNLNTFDPVDLSRRLVGADGAEGAKPLAAWFAALKAADASHLFLVVDLANLNDLPVVAVPLGPGSNPEALGRTLSESGPIRWPGPARLDGLMVAGSSEALDRIADTSSSERPDLLAALADAGTSPLRVAISPGTGLRKSLEQVTATLPGSLGGGPIEALTRGMTFGSVAVTTDPQPAVRVVVQAASPTEAQALAGAAGKGISTVAAMAQSDPIATEMAALIGQIRPEVKGDRVVVDLAPDLAARLVAVPIRKGQILNRRAQSFDNIKQIGLAFHNYHSKHSTFPPAFRASADGKPLLSWRVLILPWIEQEALYAQFHLDEPWDSPHNRTLIGKMPPTFAAPGAGAALAAEGKTTYLTPRGPGTIFPGAKGIKLDEIYDGTSNTVAVIEAQPSRAVVWTQPSDFDVPPDLGPDPGLFDPIAGGTSFGIADGSARFIPRTINPVVLRAIFSRAGGEVIDWSKF